MARQRVSIENNPEHPVDRLFVSEQPTGSAVLFVHGFRASGQGNEQYAKEAVKKGVTGLTFDLLGHGGRAEDGIDASVDEQLQKVITAFDFLAMHQGVDRERIGVAGMSFGGYLALLLSEVRPVKSLLLRSSPMYPDRLRALPRHRYTDEEALQSTPEPQNDAVEALGKFAGNTLLVVAEEDSVVSAAVTDLYARANPGVERIVLPKTDHRLTKEAQQMFKPLVTAWAQEL